MQYKTVCTHTRQFINILNNPGEPQGDPATSQTLDKKKQKSGGKTYN